MPDHVYDESGYFDDAEDEPLFRGRNPELVENEGYMFGMELSAESRYRNREWEDIEDELRRIWGQRYHDEPFDAHIQDIIRGWGDGLLGPDPEGMDHLTLTSESPGFYAGYENTRGPNLIREDEISLDDLNGDSPLGDLGGTVRIVSAEEMEGKIDKYYVDQMDDDSDLPTIDSEGARGDDSAHLD